MFAAKVRCKETLYGDGKVCTVAGAWCWICRRDGYDEGSTVREGVISRAVVTFQTRKEAGAYAAAWEGAPWWWKPDGMFEIVEIETRYVTIPEGYQLVQD